jgi:aldose 1-epimerase
VITLTSSTARVAIDAEQGGRLASLQVFGQELLVSAAPDPLHWGCYPMAPWAGRTRHGRFRFAGTTHTLPITLAPHAIHGTVWNRPWEVVDDNALRCALGPDWPFAGYAEQQFALDDNALRLRLCVHALDGPFPAVIGWHPWFRRRLETGSAARLDFSARAIYRTDEQQIPTGELDEPPPGPWDDCFTGIEREPVITWPGVLSLALHADLDHWVVYDQPRHALCVEPMSGPPDALNLGATLVTPEQPLLGEFILRWHGPFDAASS